MEENDEFSFCIAETPYINPIDKSMSFILVTFYKNNCVP